ncbi:MAG TPA: hypothetical protein VFD82_22575 [Planctomycetota bacterium]|nr:hypothetical protein [Planctomycetota bacterium]
MRLYPTLLTTLLCSLVPLTAQDQKPAAATLRVHVIGASMSGGFRDGPLTGAKEHGESVSMQHLLKQWVGDQAKATTHNTGAMMAMFTNAPKIGKDQIEDALKANPDIVVGIDFPFWFAYGFVGGEEEKAREAKFDEGLALIEKLRMPVLLGDLPDMQGAQKRMLSPAQIPSPEVLSKLNAKLRGFVAAHKNMRLVPVSTFVAGMKGKDATLPLADGPLPLAPGALLQEDRLHPTRLGMALLCFWLQDPLRELFPADHALSKQKWTFAQFVEAAGAESELQALKEAAKQPAGATPSKDR